MQIPDVDGEQIARNIKADPLGKDIGIIVLTSIGKHSDASRLEEIGCAGYLLKPVRQKMLQQALKAVLGQAHTAPGTGRLVTSRLLTEVEREKKRILLAEDNPVNQKLTTVLLQKAGYMVDVVENGRQAVEKVQQEKYSAILMDVQMPEMDGYDATLRIRRLGGEVGRIPIVAMTAHAMKGDRERCLEAGMDSYLSKPLDAKMLIHVLDQFVVSEDENILAAGKIALEPAAEKNAGKTVPPIDIEAAMPTFDNDRSFFLEMCQDFINHLPIRVEELRKAFAAGDTVRLNRSAHNLKGVAANFGAKPLTALALELETRTAGGDLETAPELIDKIQSEALRVLEFLATNEF
jgi:CheY-like chemotaxis protein/HPt (histidine-containing phosphotransfer) domain-containing protein